MILGFSIGGYFLAGILYAVIGAIVIMVHFSRIFGLEQTVLAIEFVNNLNKDIKSWKNVPGNLLLWPKRIVGNVADYWQEMAEVLYSDQLVNEEA